MILRKRLAKRKKRILKARPEIDVGRELFHGSLEKTALFVSYVPAWS
ncbi:hypothetical protein [Candidatus Hakubella thermalkaliphila]|nr:hypothetical protein [Candidatus Hakubella thermalkaliphila]